MLAPSMMGEARSVVVDHQADNNRVRRRPIPASVRVQFLGPPGGLIFIQPHRFVEPVGYHLE
jgi:hypothetical protein